MRRNKLFLLSFLMMATFASTLLFFSCKQGNSAQKGKGTNTEQKGKIEEDDSGKCAVTFELKSTCG